MQWGYSKKYRDSYYDNPFSVYKTIASASIGCTIQNFKRLGITCKKFNTLLTPEAMGNLCKDYMQSDKDQALREILEWINSFYKSHRPRALILIYAGANPNIGCNWNQNLLLNAVTYNDPQLIETLLKHGANPHVTDYNGRPIFFNIKTVKAAQLFIDHGANLNVLDATSMAYTNVLWHMLIDYTYPAELLALYLKHGTDPKQCKLDN